MKQEIKIIGENYPNVGDTIYWKDQDDDIHSDIVLSIEKNPGIETMYFISVTKNGGGEFISESDIINPMSVEIQIYKKKKLKEKLKTFGRTTISETKCSIALKIYTERKRHME